MLDCRFWNELSDRLRRKGFNFKHPDLGTRFDPVPNRMMSRGLSCVVRSSAIRAAREWCFQTFPPFRGRFQRIARTNVAAVREILAMTGKSVFVDESKSLTQFMRLTSAACFDLRGIFLTRDGRAVALSTRNHRSKSFRSAVHSWKRFYQASEQVLARTNCPILRIRYEDLCAEPERSLRKVHLFLGLMPEAWPPKNRMPEYHILGNDMRLKFRGEVQLDMRWRQALLKNELKTFERIAGDVSRRYLYTESEAEGDCQAARRRREHDLA